VRAAAGAGSFRRRERLVELAAAATARVEQLRAELDADPAAGDRRQQAAQQRAAQQRAAQQRAAREGEERVKAALDRMSELEAERTRREKTNKAEVSRQKEPRASTTDAEARAMKLADGGFTKNDDIEWAHANGIRLWCPPVHSKHRTDPYAPRPDDQPGVADWRQRMASEPGKALYKQRATAECPNAWARRWGSAGCWCAAKTRPAPRCFGSRSPTTCCGLLRCGGAPCQRQPEVVRRDANSMSDIPGCSTTARLLITAKPNGDWHGSEPSVSSVLKWRHQATVPTGVNIHRLSARGFS
jgi:hypothetical protein